MKRGCLKYCFRGSTEEGNVELRVSEVVVTVVVVVVWVKVVVAVVVVWVKVVAMVEVMAVAAM